MTTRTRTRSPRPSPKREPAMAKVELTKPDPVGVAAVAALEHGDDPDEIVIGDFVWRRVPDAVDCPDGWQEALAFNASRAQDVS